MMENPTRKRRGGDEKRRGGGGKRRWKCRGDWRERLTADCCPDEDDFVDKYCNKEFWDTVYCGEKKDSIRKFDEFCFDILKPLTTKFVKVNWDIRKKMIEEAAKVVEAKSPDDDYFKTYLKPFFDGSRYIEPDEPVPEYIRKRLGKMIFSQLYEWFAEALSLPYLSPKRLHYCGFVEDYSAHILENLKGLSCLLPYLADDPGLVTTLALIVHN